MPDIRKTLKDVVAKTAATQTLPPEVIENQRRLVEAMKKVAASLPKKKV